MHLIPLQPYTVLQLLHMDAVLNKINIVGPRHCSAMLQITAPWCDPWLIKRPESRQAAATETITLQQSIHDHEATRRAASSRP